VAVLAGYHKSSAVVRRHGKVHVSTPCKQLLDEGHVAPACSTYQERRADPQHAVHANTLDQQELHGRQMATTTGSSRHLHQLSHGAALQLAAHKLDRATLSRNQQRIKKPVVPLCHILDHIPLSISAGLEQNGLDVVFHAQQTKPAIQKT
jgi:hypothetical protein